MENIQNINTNVNKRYDFEGNDIILYAAIMAIIIGQNLSVNELNLLGNFFQAVGQNLEVLAALLTSSDGNKGLCKQN